ncbi:MAG: DUF4185 domain-containing protein [Candidatus Levyibacteriota bacterium]
MKYFHKFIFTFFILAVFVIVFPSAVKASTIFTDNFSTSSLSSVWSWQNPSGTSSYTISKGSFNLTSAKGNDQWINIDKAPKLLKTQPTAPWTIETRILSNNGNANTHGGLVIFKDAQNWIGWGQISNSTLEASGIINNTFTGQFGTMSTKYNYLRIRRVGNTYYFDASANAVNWTNANVYTDINNNLSGARLGFFAKNWNSGTFAPNYTMKFDYYKEDNTDLMPMMLSDVVTTSQIAKETGSDSINHTDTVNVCGTDLGEMFDWLGKTFIAFGDTNRCDGQPQQSGSLASTIDTTPADGLTFDGWALDSTGKAARLFVPDSGAITDVSTSGIGIGNTAYLYYMQVTNWSNWSCNLSSISTANSSDTTKWTKQSGSISWAPGNFNMVSALHVGTTVYVWGTPCGRIGSVKLMKVADTSLLNKNAYQYFTGYDGSGNATWSTSENSAVAVAGGPAGELSVQFDNWLNRYIMTYLDAQKNAIVLRESPNPWGPWNAPIQIATGSSYPNLYGAFMKSNYQENNGQTIYYMMSEFGPYNTFWMKTSLNLK